MQLNIQQADDLWQAIKDESDDLSKSNLILELARLFFECLNPTDQDLQSLKENEELTERLIDYRKIAELCNAFFKQSLVHLEPEMKETEFEKKIEQAQSNIEEVVDKTEKLKEKNDGLLKKEDELNNKQQVLQELESQLVELKKIEEEIKPERLEALENEVYALQEQVNVQEPEVKNLKAQKEDLNSHLQEISVLKEKISLENQEVRRSFVDLCNQLSERIDEKWQGVDEQLSTNLSKLKQRMRSFHDIVSRLDDSLEELEKATDAEENNLELFKRHIEANSKVVNIIQEDKAQESQNEFFRELKKISKLSREIQDSLKSYDQRLKDAITAREEFRQKIRRLNKPGQKD